MLIAPAECKNPPSVGQTVLMKQEKCNKFSTQYNHRPFRVIALNGTVVTAERAGILRTCHVSYFKPYNVLLPDNRSYGNLQCMKRKKREEIHNPSIVNRARTTLPSTRTMVSQLLHRRTWLIMTG